jgi:hypothetical protein
MKTKKRLYSKRRRRYTMRGGGGAGLEKSDGGALDKEIRSEPSLIKTKQLRCGPKTKHNRFTCLEDSTLLELKELWNKNHRNDQIVASTSQGIWNQLNEKMKGTCNDELCWLKQPFVNGKFDHDIHNLFAPKSPHSWKSNPREWLSSDDITNVMRQYQNQYKCFEFIGPSPIDFDLRRRNNDCVCNKLCNFQIQHQIDMHKTKIGIIFNIDPHTKGGSHWVSMFINIKKGTIFFFDSTGRKIPKRIMLLVDRIIEQGRKLVPKPIHFKFDQNNPTEHQYGDTECGIYSLFFIVHMLEDKITDHYLKTHILKDEFMQQFRKVYFN